ncbi:unnamed protein product [Tilletia laevis]|nr:unnamed protein product [Tilletia caries]CAD6939318.1 unnamed protein product [Tilletia laevis]
MARTLQARALPHPVNPQEVAQRIELFEQIGNELQNNIDVITTQLELLERQGVTEGVSVTRALLRQWQENLSQVARELHNLRG